MKVLIDLVSVLFLFVSSASVSHAQTGYDPKYYTPIQETRVHVKGQGCIYVDKMLICNPPRYNNIVVFTFNGRAEFDTGFSGSGENVIPACNKILSWNPGYGDVYFWPQTQCLYDANHQRTNLRYPNGYITCISKEDCGHATESVPNPYLWPGNDLENSEVPVGVTAEIDESTVGANRNPLQISQQNPSAVSNVAYLPPSDNYNANDEEGSKSDIKPHQIADETNAEFLPVERRRRSNVWL